MRLNVLFCRYVARDSAIHRMDPRIKISCMMAFIVLAFVASGFLGMAMLVLAITLAIILAKLKPSELLGALAPLLVLLAFPLVFNILFITEGDVLFNIGFLTFTNIGISRALYMTLRLLILFTAGSLLTLTTTNIELCDAVASMLKPFTRFGVPAYEIALMVSIALRFVPLLAKTYERIYKSLLARGANLGRGGPIARIKALVPVLTALFASAFRQSEELGIAMESRCYNGAARTHYRIMSTSRRDYIAIASMLALTLSLIILRGIGL